MSESKSRGQWDKELAKTLFDQGLTYPEIAAQCGTTQKAVAQWARKSGLRRGPGFRRSNLADAPAGETPSAPVGKCEVNSVPDAPGECDFTELCEAAPCSSYGLFLTPEQVRAMIPAVEGQIRSLAAEGSIHEISALSAVWTDLQQINERLEAVL